MTPRQVEPFMNKVNDKGYISVQNESRCRKNAEKWKAHQPKKQWNDSTDWPAFRAHSLVLEGAGNKPISVYWDSVNAFVDTQPRLQQAPLKALGWQYDGPAAEVAQRVMGVADLNSNAELSYTELSSMLQGTLYKELGAWWEKRKQAGFRVLDLDAQGSISTPMNAILSPVNAM